MTERVAIIGVGSTPFRFASPEVSFREMVYDAAVRAYADAGVAVGEIESFVSCTEDLIEGTSISDEYCPDQLGAAAKPVHTIAGDGIHGLASAVMLIRSGLFQLMAVEAHSKASNVDNLEGVLAYAMDPVTQRVLGLHPHAVAALEMRRFLHDSGNRPSQCAAVVSKNRAAALRNPLASNGGTITAGEVLDTEEPFSPIHTGEIAPHADGAIVLVLAAERKARRARRPIWVRGIGWASDSYALETRGWGEARYSKEASGRAFKMAGIRDPRKGIDIAEVDDSYAFKELQHLEAVGLAPKGQAGRLVERLLTKGPNGRGPLGLAVNPSGGVIGVGNLGEANGLARVSELVWQLRGEAGARQLDRARTGLALSWRGIPTATGAAIVLGVNKP